MVGGQDGLRWTTLDGATFLSRVDGLADELAERLPGLEPGDRVVTWLPNHWRTPVYFFALWKLGLVVVPFDREMNADAARAILVKVEPRCVLTGFGIEPEWAQPGSTLEWWAPGEKRTFGVATSISPDGLAAIFFTSGTTGAPKGCEITHANFRYQVEALPALMDVGPTCRLASILPLSHLFEFTVGMLYPLLRGASVSYVPSRRGDDIVRVLQEQRVTHMLLVPQVLSVMGDAVRQRMEATIAPKRLEQLLQLARHCPMWLRRQLFRSVHRRLGGQLRRIVSGGAALDPDLQRFWEALGMRIVQGYGTSECSPVIAGGKDDGSTPIGSVGKALPGTEIRLGPSRELLVRGPGIMRGYYHDQARTAEVLDADGWYATGDLAKVDAEGNITIEGRVKELLVLPSGMNVWPQDVEDALRRDRAVKDAVVVLAKQPGGGATLHAYLIPSGGSADGELNAIIARVNGRLAQHQRIASASWWPSDDFPRTHTLKVIRGKLPPPDQAPRASTKIDVTQAADDPVATSIAEVARRPNVHDQDVLASLGLDSLALTELTLVLEAKTGITLSDGTLRTDMTVADARSVVRDAGLGRDVSVPQAVDEDGRPHARRAQVEASAWMPPVGLYRRGRFLRRLSWPITLVHRHFVPQVHLLHSERLLDLPDRVVFAATHRSFADVPTLQRALRQSPATWRWNRIVVAASAGIMSDACVLGRLVTAAFGIFPLRQYSDRQASLRLLARVIDEGNSLLMFPQGRHTLPAEEIALVPAARFKPGVAHMATQLELPVVPIGIAGDEAVIPGRVPPEFRGKVIAGIPLRPQRHPVAVAFGAPLWSQEGETMEAFTLRIETAAFALAREGDACLLQSESGA
jgi:long-chain acyl-CoA synthetase